MPGMIWTRWKVLAKMVMLQPAAYAINRTPDGVTVKLWETATLWIYLT
jgi:hypothetical protein